MNIVLIVSECNTYCKSFNHKSSTAPMVEWLKGHAGKQGVRCWLFRILPWDKNFFVMFTCSVFLAAGLAAFK